MNPHGTLNSRNLCWRALVLVYSSDDQNFWWVWKHWLLSLYLWAVH